MEVSVDDKLARFGGKSYAINKINSVEVRRTMPYGKGAALVFGLFAIICLLSIQDGGASMFVVALIFGALAYWGWQRSKIVEYQLYLMTSSSEAQALTTRNGDEIYALRDKIEHAIASS
jgi:hypothetical protein